jgi:hypothetical protein
MLALPTAAQLYMLPFGRYASTTHSQETASLCSSTTGEDEVWGRRLGTVLFAPDVLHDLRSVSKSVLSLAYGIALATGQVPTPEARLYDQFPEYPDLAGPKFCVRLL